MKRIVVASFVASSLAVSSLTLGGCGLLSPAEETLIPLDAGQLTTDPGIGMTVIPAAERGEPLEISGIDLAGDDLSLADFRGDITVVNAWATWCAPCRAEKPEFAEVAADFEGRGVSFVGLNVQDEGDAARDFTADTPYPSIVDEDGSMLARIPEVPPRALPITVILDRQGRIAVRIVGPIVLGSLADTVNSVLAQEAAQSG